MRKIFSRIEAPSSGRPEAEVFTLGSRSLHAEEIIAEGGFGIVFLVRSNSPRKLLALKRMFVNNDRDLAICRREINIVSSLGGSHPHLIGYVDSSVTALRDGVTEVLLLMPYHRTNLLGLMNELLASGGGAFPEEEVLLIFTQIASAVARLHHCSTPIIHRDLKVENILRSEDHKYILCDFGSATIRVLNPSVQGITQVEEEIKRYTTLAYRSPEMVDLYANKSLTTKLDIWALGCLLYHICFLTLPFGDSTLAIQSGTFSFPKKHNYSEKLLKLIRYLLTPDMDSRPDIFQASYLACSIAKRECTVQNLHNVALPNLDSISLSGPPEIPSVKAASSKGSNSADSGGGGSIESTSGSAKAGVVPLASSSEDSGKGKGIIIHDKMTSIAPRQRPKGTKCKPGGPPAILPLAPSTGMDPPSVPVAAPGPQGGHSTSNVQQPSAAAVIREDPPSNGSWNPFSEPKSMSEEDALFGEQFDRLRQESASPRISRKDPFGSAPFSLFKKDP